MKKSSHFVVTFFWGRWINLTLLAEKDGISLLHLLESVKNDIDRGLVQVEESRATVKIRCLDVKLDLLTPLKKKAR